jgi:tetratricopeptide (TPR) repeat protein
MKAHYLRRLPFIHPRSKPIRWSRFFIFLVVSLILAYSTLLIILGAGNVIPSFWFYILPPILTFLGLLLTLYPLVFPSFEDRKSSILNEYGLQQVRQLNPSNYKLFRYIKHAYILRDADSLVRIILRGFSGQNYQNETLGICIFGKPAQGKTRLAWEAMQAELANWTLVRWSHLTQVPFDFDAQQGKQVILWLDDLHEYANPKESVIINDLPRRFLEKGTSLIIIATCRDGEDQLQATKYLEKLLEQLIPISLENISTNEALNLSKLLVQEGLEVSSDDFDGTPGSLIFGLQRMTSRYLNLASSAQIILKAMKLLHSARIHTYTEKIVKNVSFDVFGLGMKEWRKSYESLSRSDFIRVTVRNNERIIEPVAEIYLEKVVIDYPTPHSKLTDDWISLKESFQHSRDADSLNTLGLSANWESFKPQQETYQFAEECYHSALEIYFDVHDDAGWAGTQNNLGILYFDQAELAIRDQAIKLLHKGIEAFNAALTVFSKENTPAYWIMVQCNLGSLLNMKAGLVNDEEKLTLLDHAIQIFQNILNIEPQDLMANAEILTNLGIALCQKAELVEQEKQNQFLDLALQTFGKVLTIHDHNSFAWAKAQTNLGAAFALKSKVTNNQEEKLNLLNQAAQSHRAAITVFTKESVPLQWARTQLNLGSVLSNNAEIVQEEVRNKLLTEANAVFHAALTILSKESTPKLWCVAQFLLGTVLLQQVQLMSGKEQLQQLNEAIQAYYAVLEVYNKANSPAEWARVQNGLGKALYEKATLEDGLEEPSLLEESIQAFHNVLEVCTYEH